jgi:hypothetical protein
MTAIASGWENFFVAEVGAAAALSGLLFVAVSINLTRILAILSVLAVATFGLVPDQSRGALGAEVGGTGLLVWLLTVRTQLRAYRDLEARRWLPTRVLATQAACVPFVVAGGLLLAGRDSGVYWIVPGTVASFGAGVLNAWVLLVEIQR